MAQTARIDLGKHLMTLKNKLDALMPEVGDYPTPFEGVQMYRRHEAMEHKSIIYKPVVIIIAQGQKCVRIGDDELIYGENSYFVAGVDMPTACAMRNTTPENPYLSIAIDLDRSLIAQLAAEVPPVSGKENLPSRGAMVAEMDVGFLDALLRLVELIEEPGQASVLQPLIIKEIHYRLLATPFGNKLRAINTFGTPSNQIAQAIAWLSANFRTPIDVEELAKHANMATSTLHKHFKEVTALSPLQYQKRLRLAEAQRLMMTMGYDTAQACAEVGYESLTQFNREYKRLFGAPPRRDVVRMQTVIGEQPSAVAI